LSPRLLHLLDARERELMRPVAAEKLSNRLALRLAAVAGRPVKPEPAAAESAKHQTKEA
jgi:hypothetical protein